MKTSLLRPARRGFTLIEVMVATAIMMVIVLAVVTIAADTFKAYDRAVAEFDSPQFDRWLEIPPPREKMGQE